MLSKQEIIDTIQSQHDGIEMRISIYQKDILQAEAAIEALTRELFHLNNTLKSIHDKPEKPND